ncbi:transmembrane emp24 domain-containing protein 11 [Ovis aries]|nr:transmembrane emp24 domain-containing protein 11 [Ovis aries]
MFVTVTTYSDEVLLSRLHGPQGAFYFTSHSPGEHIICLQSNSTRLVSFGGSKLRVHLDIRVGEHDLDAAITQAKDKVNEVSFKLEHLIEQIEQIVKEQNYQRDREEKFRMTSEDTNSNVLWWAFTQTLIFISVGIFQMKSLKDFFIAKKLV